MNKTVFFHYGMFFLGYILLYIARQTIPIALPLLVNFESTNHLALSYLFAFFSIFYGLFKFINGIIMDLVNYPLVLFGLSQIITGLTTISMPFLYSHPIFCPLIVMLLAWAQGAGWPAITKFITTNFETRFIASLWGIMSVSHQLGSFISLILLPHIIELYNPKSAFLCSGFLCLSFGIYLMLPIHHRRNHYHCPKYRVNKLLKFYANIKISHSILLLCGATFCVYIVRMGIFFWFPIILKNILHISLFQSSFITSIHDLGGVLGALITGRLSDLYFPKKRHTLASIYMLLTAGVFFVMNFFFKPIY